MDNAIDHLQFGAPPILENLKDELLEYLVNPEKLSIYQLDNVQQYWKRNKQLLTLFNADLSPLSTCLQYSKDPVTGSITNVKEVKVNNVGKNVRNCMLMTRKPGPSSESIKGNKNNFLFWPGGFERQNELDRTVAVSDINFDIGLKTVVTGLKSGIEFQIDNCTPKGKGKPIGKLAKKLRNKEIPLDLACIIKNEAVCLDYLTSFNKSKINYSNKMNKIKDVPDIDDVIVPFVKTQVPVLKILETPAYTKKTEWAEQIDLMHPAVDFEKKISEPAMTFSYQLDNFQKQAILKLEEHKDVFVAAHTSAGKTTIAEYAIAMSQHHMTRTIYTSPIKALSNQKFREFREKFDSVGLITGDVQINEAASCLIMTTEILQSMLYCAAEVLRDVEYVVFDEVHYINNEERGHVWEEVIILLPPTINIVMLSATVPNPVEFAHWVGQIKKRKMYVISTIKRPVPLQHYLYTGFDDKTKDQMYLIVNKEGKFQKNNLIKAVKSQELCVKSQQQKKTQDNKKFNLNKNFNSPMKIVKKVGNCQETLNADSEMDKEEKLLEDKLKAEIFIKKERELWTALLDNLQRHDKLPVVVFTFSRIKCDQTAETLTKSLLTYEERRYVKEFFNKSIEHLKGTDRKLPQVIKLKKLLELGVGLHHSGILPILKEIVEMLFQKGLVKVLYATETFAMGVNMPAKTVVFETMRKYDGSVFRNLLPTEYIQMAGRAGRRGHDDTGTVVVLCKDKIPNERNLMHMMLGAPQNLESRFKVTYSMVLHLKRLSETISISDMMRRSFREVDTLSNLPKYKDEFEKITKLVEENSLVGESNKQLENFFDMCQYYLQYWKYFRQEVLQSSRAMKVLIPGRILMICYSHHINKMGILVSLVKKDKEIFFKVFVLTSINEENSKNKSENWYKIMALLKSDLFIPPRNCSYNILLIPCSSVFVVTDYVLNCNFYQIISDWEKRQSSKFQNMPYNIAVNSAMHELANITNEALVNPNILTQPNLIQDINIKSHQDALNNIYRSLTQTFNGISQMQNFEKKFDKVLQFKELEAKQTELSQKLSDEYLENYPEYLSRVKLLKELKYIDDNDKVTLKGRVALEMGIYEILLTELLLDNIIANWPSEAIVAMLSSLVVRKQKRNDELVKEDIPILNEVKQKMTSIYQKLIAMEVEYDLEPMEKPGFHLMRVVYEWAHGKSFANIMNFTDAQEGIIVRCILKLNEVLRDVKNAAAIIGNPSLRDKMEEASSKIKRDIVFTPSLYTQDIVNINFEIPKT